MAHYIVWSCGIYLTIDPHPTNTDNKEDETISQSNTFQLDEACNPRNGDYLSVDVWNMGTCDIKVDFYIDNGDDLQFSDSKIISYNSNGYHVYIESKNGEGLDCAFGLTITPIPNGEEMVADVMVNQYFK